VESQRQLDAAEGKRVGAAVLLAVDLGQSLPLEPFADFVVGNDCRAGPLGKLNGIADVVGMGRGR
jgi:hypothetical protein